MTLPIRGRTLGLLAILVPLLALFVWVVLRAGPLAPVTVTVATVQSRAIQPALFGIGTVQARYTYKIGPTLPARVRTLNVHVGDAVKAGQLLGEMDPVDLDSRMQAQQAVLGRAEASVREAQARQAFARSQAERYRVLEQAQAVSRESLDTRRQELQIADAALTVSQQELARARADQQALRAQRDNLRLLAPVDGVVVLRDADPGTTIVAGQTVIELLDPKTLWINSRFDQVRAAGLAAELPAQIVLRSGAGEPLAGLVSRIEPKADAVTEETLAKVDFAQMPTPLPPIGELAEVTVTLPALPAAPTIPNAAVHRQNGQTGVWRIQGNNPVFTPVQLGAADLDGHVQVHDGLKEGDQLVVYSEKPLNPRHRLQVVEQIAKGAK